MIGNGDSINIWKDHWFLSLEDIYQTVSWTFLQSQDTM